MINLCGEQLPFSLTAFPQTIAEVNVANESDVEKAIATCEAAAPTMAVCQSETVLLF